MNIDILSPADKLRQAIKEYEQTSGRSLFSKLLEENKVTIKEASFNKKLQRMEENKLLADSDLLYNILNIIGIKYEYLFNNTNPEEQTAYYLNQINKQLLEIKKNQEQAAILANRLGGKLPKRFTTIKKLDRIFSITYLIEKCLQPFLVKDDTYKSYFFYQGVPLLNLIPDSDYFKLIQKGQLLFKDTNTTSIFGKLFNLCFINYGVKNNACLKDLHFYFNSNEISGMHREVLGIFGLNYLCILLVYEYIQAFCSGMAFADNLTVESDNIKYSFRTLISDFEKTFKFIYTRISIKLNSFPQEKIKFGFERLNDTLFFIDGLLSLHIPYWLHYKMTEENNPILVNQQNPKKITEEQNKSIIDLCKKIQQYDLQDKRNVLDVCSIFRYEVNTMLYKSAYGFQIPNPISKRQFELLMSKQLAKTKLALPEQNENIAFFQKEKGYLETMKQLFN